jgi:hypothetical protein
MGRTNARMKPAGKFLKKRAGASFIAQTTANVVTLNSIKIIRAVVVT